MYMWRAAFLVIRGRGASYELHLLSLQCKFAALATTAVQRIYLLLSPIIHFSAMDRFLYCLARAGLRSSSLRLSGRSRRRADSVERFNVMLPYLLLDWEEVHINVQCR